MRRFLFVILALMALTGVVLAQDATAGGGTDDVILMLYNVVGGAVISFIVHWLKGLRFVSDYPKVSATVISVIATLIPVIAKAPWASKGIGLVAVSLFTQVFAAIGTHETVTKPITAKAAATAEVRR